METEKVYCGVDFHARMQTVAFCRLGDGEVQISELHHQKDDIRGFYSQFTGEVIVGLETGGYSSWFEAMVEEMGHTVWLGHAAEIRRRGNWRQKNDRRDAELILDIMIRGDFPRIHRHNRQSVASTGPVRRVIGRRLPACRCFRFRCRSAPTRGCRPGEAVCNPSGSCEASCRENRGCGNSHRDCPAACPRRPARKRRSCPGDWRWLPPGSPCRHAHCCRGSEFQR